MRRIIDKHPPGAFCWIELSTTDQNAAKGFYNSLFGWTAKDFPMGPNDFYTMFQLEGRDTGAAYTMRSEQRSQGVPPHWMIYIAVANADDAANRATQLGGKVLAPPCNVYDIGRMAVAQDPTGVVFALWQTKTHTGTGIAGVHGSLCWADLITPDLARAKTFYTGLFGWRISASENDPSGYLHIANGEDFIDLLMVPRSLVPAMEALIRDHRNPNQDRDERERPLYAAEDDETKGQSHDEF